MLFRHDAQKRTPEQNSTPRHCVTRPFVGVGIVAAAVGITLFVGVFASLRARDAHGVWRLPLSADLLPSAWRSPDAALASAVARGDVAGAENALRRGASPNARLTLLATASDVGASPRRPDAEKSASLLVGASRPGEAGSDAVCLLRVAAANPDPAKAAALTRVLLAGGAHPDGKALPNAAPPNAVTPDPATPDTMTPLMEAAFRGDAETEKILLRAGANPAARDPFGFTPLIWLTWGAATPPETETRPQPPESFTPPAAASSVAAPAAQASPPDDAPFFNDDVDNTPLYAYNDEDAAPTAPPAGAATQRYADAATALLEHGGANVNAADHLSGGTALNYAASRGETDLVRVLLAWGADPRLPDADGATPLDAAEWAKHKPTAAALKAALAASPAPLTTPPAEPR